MINVNEYMFDGPFTNTGFLNHQAGIYVLLCGSDFVVIDVGESSDVKHRIENHERMDCWRRNCSGDLSVAVMYTPGLDASNRCKIEAAIRTHFSPSCGER